MKRVILFITLISFLRSQLAWADVSPAAVGWGNLIVPGLGATFRGAPARGLTEAVLELGLFYGGTFGVREGDFTIDTTVTVPQRGDLTRPLLGQAMQQIGLKLHMYDTFYNYQQACLASKTLDREIHNPQPLYKGEWDDVLLAPFKWKNISSPWVFGAIAALGAGLAVAYHNTDLKQNAYRPSSTEYALYATDSIGLIPIGSAFGEEPLFRGFMQREFHLYTGNLFAAVLMQTAVFTALHPSDHYIPALAGGLYFGFLTHHFDGDLEQAIATHFWVNLISGVFDYFEFRASHGASAPWSPKVKLNITLPLVL